MDTRGSSSRITLTLFLPMAAIPFDGSPQVLVEARLSPKSELLLCPGHVQVRKYSRSRYCHKSQRLSATQPGEGRIRKVGISCAVATSERCSLLSAVAVMPAS